MVERLSERLAAGASLHDRLDVGRAPVDVSDLQSRRELSHERLEKNDCSAR
jgi:hypothetical protein